MIVSRLLRRAGTAAGGIALAAILLFAIHMLAARIVATHLLHEAQHQAAALQSGQSLWQWALRKPHDLVAGQAFGHASAAADGDGLRITSADGTPFELGLPIDRAADLAHWPLLQLQLDSSTNGTLGLIRQSAPGASACTATAAAALLPQQHQLLLDLSRLSWLSANGDRCTTTEPAWMLRLRIQLPAGGRVWLHAAALRSADAPPLPTAPTLTLRSTDEIGSVIAGTPEVHGIPWIALPPDASAETMLTLRDHLRARWPAALVVPASGNPLPGAPVEWPQGWAWLGFALYLSLLLVLTRWQPYGASRPWLEITACLAGPLWLVAGLQWGPRLALAAVSATLGALLYAVAMEWRQRPRSWRVGGSASSWLWPMLPALIALMLLLGWGQALHPPAASHVLLYLVWAGLQQWLMLGVTMPRLQKGLHGLPESPRTALACLITAALFALLHTPNGALMQLCLLAELWWAWCFTRSRSLLPVVLAHACCGLLVESGLFGVLLRSLEVSARFFL